MNPFTKIWAWLVEVFSDDKPQQQYQTVAVQPVEPIIVAVEEVAQPQKPKRRYYPKKPNANKTDSKAPAKAPVKSVQNKAPVKAPVKTQQKSPTKAPATKAPAKKPAQKQKV